MTEKENQITCNNRIVQKKFAPSITSRDERNVNTKKKSYSWILSV